MLRLHAQIYFGNVNFLKETLDRLEQQQSEPLRAVVLDGNGINQVNASGEVAFREVLDGYRSRDVRLVFANIKRPVLDVFERSGLDVGIGQDAFFLNVGASVESVAGRGDAESHEPKRTFDGAVDERHSKASA